VKDLGTQRIPEPPLSGAVVDVATKASKGKQAGGGVRRRGGGRQ
jgi:hypothetical protein